MAGRGPVEKKKIAQRRALVSELFLAGHRHLEDLRERLKEEGVTVSVATISKDLSALRADWLEQSLENTGERIALELARIARVEREAWAGWERSHGPHVEETMVTRPGAKGKSGVGEVRRKTVPLAGDPRFLRTVLDAIERRCKLLGLDAPEVVRAFLSQVAPGANVEDRLQDMSDQQLSEFLHGMLTN